MAVKGCINITCAAFHKRISYKKSDDFCSKCGQPLYYVCKKCYKPLENASDRYCPECNEEMALRRAELKEKAMKAGKVALKASEVAIKVAPFAASIPGIKKIAPKIQKAAPVVEKAKKIVKK